MVCLYVALVAIRIMMMMVNARCVYAKRATITLATFAGVAPLRIREEHGVYEGVN